MSDDLIAMKTKTGGLDFHLAAAGCYVPVMMLNYLVPVVFLATEPKEHRPVRFHAAQSLLVSGVWIVSLVALGVVSFLLPALFFVGGSVLGMEDLFSMIGLLLNLVLSLAVVAVALGGFGGLLLLTVLCAMQKDPRVPVLAGLADRFVGAPV